jgi:anti-sigma factor ChrR (cupin superfamily)
MAIPPRPHVDPSHLLFSLPSFTAFMLDAEHLCFCELAPLYALDLLDLEERLWVEAQILNCPDLAEELANYQTAVGVMPYSAPPVPMAADLKDRLFDRLGLDAIDSIADPEPEIPPTEVLAPEMFAIRSQDMQWQSHRIPGVEVVMLFVDPIQRMRLMEVKAAAGVIYPPHRHAGIEEIYMLEGELVINDRVYLAGDYIRSYPESIHAPSTDTGCRFLIRACIDDEYF